jgi:hypothetical protein
MSDFSRFACSNSDVLEELLKSRTELVPAIGGRQTTAVDLAVSFVLRTIAGQFGALFLTTTLATVDLLEDDILPEHSFTNN